MRELLIIVLYGLVVGGCIAQTKHNHTGDCEDYEEESDEEALRRHEQIKAQARAAAQARMIKLGLKVRTPVTSTTPPPPPPLKSADRQAQARAAAHARMIALGHKSKLAVLKDEEQNNIVPVKDYLVSTFSNF